MKRYSLKRYFLFITSFILLFFNQISFAQNVGDYRTIASGNWSNLAMWEQFDGSLWNSPAFYPGQAPPTPGTVVTIQAGHTTALNVSPASHIVDLTINAGATLDLFTCNILQYSGTLTNNGTTVGTIGKLVPLRIDSYRSNATIGNWTDITSWQKFDGTFWVSSADYPGQNAPALGQAVFIRNGNNITADAALDYAIGRLVVYAGSTVTNGAAPYILAPTFQSCGTATEIIFNNLLVTNTNDAGAGSLRQAITDANNLTGADLINFQIPGMGVQTISLSSPLPIITEQVTLNGWSQTGWSGTPLIEITGAGAINIGLQVQANNCIIRGLILNNYSQGAIHFFNATGGTVQGCYIGTNSTGTTAITNTLYGVRIQDCTNITVGGTTTNARNLISGNNATFAYGVVIQGGSANFVKGNWIGIDASGATALGNTIGVGLESLTTGNVIGGTTIADRNVISGNGQFGVWINSAAGNFVQGNYIGTAVDGVSDVGNNDRGVAIFNSSRNRVGGTSPNEANIIAFTKDTGTGFGYGVGVNSGLNGNPILGNSIFGNVVGIDLNLDRITSNDSDDPDIGGNRLQNFPEFSGIAVLNAGQVTITYKVPSVSPNATYPLRIEFFRADAGSRQGRTYLGFDTYVPAEANTNKTLTFTPFTPLALGDRIVATATDANASGNNTSEFSAEVSVGLANAGLHPDDYAALLALYNATGGANWTSTTANNQAWFVDGDAENWFGITTDGTPPSATRRVREIRLNSNNLVGTLPIEIGNLIDVRIFWVMVNSISNTIPTTIGNLVNLTDIRLHNNPISGEIPASMGNLVNLDTLGFGDMELSGSVPTTFSNLTKLKAIYLQGNNLNNATIFNTSNFNDLTLLRLSNNQLSGTIPNSLGDLNLSELSLSNNLFTNMEDFSSKPFVPMIFDVSNNKLEFDDIKPNVGKLTNYSPQAPLGTPQNFAVNMGATQTLTVSTPNPATAPANTYQWFFYDGMNFNAIAGANSPTYTIVNYDNGKAGVYRCQVSNGGVPSLTLQSTDFSVGTNANGVFQQDFNALQQLYNNTVGSGWLDNTNWLSTADVSTWFGITVVNNRVTEIRLPNNNLIVEIGSPLIDLNALKVLDISNNQLSSDLFLPPNAPLEVFHINNNLYTGDVSNQISVLSAYTNTLKSVDLSNNQFTGSITYDFVENFAIEPINLPNRRGFNVSNNEITSSNSEVLDNSNFRKDVLNVSNNRLTFGDIADFISRFYESSSQYAPQKPVLLNPNSAFGITGSNFIYNPINLDPGRGNCIITQEWFNTTDLVNPIATTKALTFLPFDATKAGTYLMKARATCVPDLELVTEVLTVQVTPNTFVVDNNGDIDDGNYGTGNFTLREAIRLANEAGGNKTINFNLPNTGLVININGNNPYQDISNPNITIDGTTQTGYAGTPLVVINGVDVGGNNVPQAFNIISVGCKIYGLEIRNIKNLDVITGNGIRISGNNADFQIGDIGKGNYIHDNYDNGILVFATRGNIVGNTISGNQNRGIFFSGTGRGSNVNVEKNNIGITLAGTAVSGVQPVGVRIENGGFSTVNLNIGTSGKGNVIGGHSGGGISIENTSSVNIIGNYIGTNPNSANLGNVLGIGVDNASSAITIDGNIVSGNSSVGISINQGNNHQIINNKIGTNPAGTAAFPNGTGIELSGTNISTIQNNLISGNTNTGLYLIGITGTNRVYNNLIGTDISGTSPIPNLEGIRIEQTENTLIGEIADATKANTIAYNSQKGIVINDLGFNNTFDNTIGINAIFCNGAGADQGIEITNGANGGIATPPLTVTTGTYNCTGTPTVTVNVAGLNTITQLDLYKIDETCGTNQGKTYVGTFNPTGLPSSITLTLANLQMEEGTGTYVFMGYSGANSSQFSNEFTLYNSPTIIDVQDNSYPDCRGFNQQIVITLSDDSPDGDYYLDFGNINYPDIPSIFAIDHKITINVLIPSATPPFDLGGLGAYFNITRALGCIPNLFPTTLTPYTTGAIPPPTVVAASVSDATSCATPNGRLVLQMANVEEDQFYFVDIDGDGRADFEAVQAQNNQLIIDEVADGTEITSITVTQPLLFCTSNQFSFSYIYPTLPIPDATLLVYPEFEFVEKGQDTKVIIEETENGVSYQLESADTETLIGDAVDGNGGIIELPTERLQQTFTYRVLAKNKISGCSTLLETSATIGVDLKCIAPADSLILIELYRGANGVNWFTPWDLQSPACTWFGVELVGDRVVNLRLANNDLAGRLPVSLANLPRLKSIDVSSNFLGFEAIEPLVNVLASKNIPFIYAPQAEILSPEIRKASQGTTARLSALTGGTANKYQWFKIVNDNAVALKDEGNIRGANEAILVLSNVTIANEGDYFCEISSPIATELILYRAVISLSVVPELNAQDIAALIRFFNSLGGANWKRPWKIDEPITNWEGLVFESGNLVQINLSNNNLSGQIPDLFDAPIFEDLVYLNLSNNNLNGKLPEKLKFLLKLTYLDLSQNDLEGEVPAWIGDLSELITLWLSYNRFTELSADISNLSKLRNLFLNTNEFEQIPDEIGFLLNLEILDLSDNYLEELTEQIGSLLKLKYLSVSDNFLIELPESLVLLIDLEELHAFNNFIYYLPTGLEKLGDLKFLTLDFNDLDFGDLEVVVDQLKKALPNLDFLYAPQSRIGTEQTLDIPLGSPIVLEIKTEGKENTYQWYKDGKPIAGATNAILKIERADRENAGIYVVFVGNKIAKELVLQSQAYIVRTNCVGTMANLAIEVRGETTYCDQDRPNAVLVAPQVENTASYQWFLNNVPIANANNDRINARELGSYTVNLITKENCVSTSPAVIIRRFAPPQVSVSADRDLLSAITQAIAVSYEWFFNGATMPSEVSAQLTATQSGRYAVRITDRNGCKGTSAIYNHIFTSAEDETYNANLKVYPNPTNNTLNIESKIEKITNLQLHDLTGKKINVQIDQNQARFTLSLDQLAVGVYLLEIKTSKSTIWRKVVKE
jgi:Leucine-rich repeat (LRR) protein